MNIEDCGSIWYIHPYAGGPGVGRYDRPYHLARHWSDLGQRSVILTPSVHHLMDIPRMPGVERIGGVTYEFIRSPNYLGNGLGRLVNMAVFTAQLVYKANLLACVHGRPKLVIASSPHPYAWFAANWLARRFGARSIFEVRDLWPLSLIELAGISPGHPLVRFTGWLEKRAYKQADGIVSLLPCTQEHMLSRGLDIKRWHYVPNGIEPETQNMLEITDTAPVALARHWRSEGRTVVVYAGALGRPNHVESLVQAMALQRDAGQTSGAIIVGRGESKEKLQQMIGQLKLANHVVLFEQIPKKDVLILLREASMGFISLRPESIFRFGVSPNKLFDYMLASLPVLFAVKAGNDPVAESGCGMTVDPGDPKTISAGISWLSGLSEDGRRAMGARGLEYVLNRHSYRELAKEYLRLADPSS